MKLILSLAFVISAAFADNRLYADREVQPSAKANSLFNKQKQIFASKNSKVIRFNKEAFSGELIQMNIAGKDHAFSLEKGNKNVSSFREVDNNQNFINIVHGKSGIAGSMLISNKLYSFREIDGELFHLYEEDVSKFNCGNELKGGQK